VLDRDARTDEADSLEIRRKKEYMYCASSLEVVTAISTCVPAMVHMDLDLSVDFQVMGCGGLESGESWRGDSIVEAGDKQQNRSDDPISVLAR